MPFDCSSSCSLLFYYFFKAMLKSAPVLLAPRFDKEFKMAVDTSDAGADSVFLQKVDHGVDHSVCYFSKKFNKH